MDDDHDAMIDMDFIIQPQGHEIELRTQLDRSNSFCSFRPRVFS